MAETNKNNPIEEQSQETRIIAGKQIIKRKRKSVPYKDRKKTVITEDTPLTDLQQKFVACYLKSGNATQAYVEAGYKCDKLSDNRIGQEACKLKAQPNIQKQILDARKKYFKEKMATGEEVMAYLAAVVRGEIKDQFGLEAPVSERTRAALEIARRTFDLDLMKTNNVQQQDNTIKIQVDWKRD